MDKKKEREKSDFDVIGEEIICFKDWSHPEFPWRCEVYTVRRDGRKFHSSVFYSTIDETGYKNLDVERP
jgi:hypothetical protein